LENVRVFVVRSKGKKQESAKKVTTICAASISRPPTELVQSPKKRYIAALQALFPFENYLLSSWFVSCSPCDG
jgi:hypothetical protein